MKPKNLMSIPMFAKTRRVTITTVTAAIRNDAISYYELERPHTPRPLYIIRLDAKTKAWRPGKQNGGGTTIWKAGKRKV